MLRYDGQVKYDGLLGLSSHGEMVSCLLRKYESLGDTSQREQCYCQTPSDHLPIPYVSSGVIKLVFDRASTQMEGA